MSMKLYRLGQWSFRRRWWVVGFWFATLLGVVLLLGSQGGARITSAITIDGTESERVIKDLHREFPELSGSQGSMVFHSPDGDRLDEGATAAGLRQLAEDVHALDAVVQRSDTSGPLSELGAAAKNVDLEKVQEVLDGIPEGTDLGELQGLLSSLPSELDLDQLRQQLLSMPPVMDPSQLGQMIPGLPSDIDVEELQSTFSELPQEINLNELRKMLAGSAGEIGLVELAELDASLPEGTHLGDLFAVMDLPVLSVDGEQVPGVLLSEDGRTAMFQIQLAKQIEDIADADLEQIIKLARDAAADLGLDVHVGDSLKPHTAPLGGGEVFGLLVAALVLILTLGTLRAAGLPLVTALVGVGVGLGGALALSHRIEITSATPVLALMVGLAVGIDYALFIVNRTRELMRRDGRSALEATGQAVGTAGSAVVFAGLTVVIALTGLTLIGISFLTTMALVAAVTVALAVLVAITLLPALLGFVGEGLVSKRARDSVGTTEPDLRASIKWSQKVIAHRGVISVLVVVVLGVLAIPAFSMGLGMPDGSTASAGSDERQAHDMVARDFGQGYNAPLITVAKAAEGEEFDPLGLPVMAIKLKELPGVATAQPMGLSSDGKVAIVSVIPEQEANSEGTTELVHELRDSGADVLGGDVRSVGVAGLTAVNLDISEKLASVLPTYIAIIVVLSLLVLLLVFRSVLIPVKATVGFLLSIGATFGIVTTVFQWGWAKELFGFDTTGPILSFLPIMVTGILYGLAMDYEMFLVTSMRQAHVQGHEGDGAVVEGFARASRVVVAAATIMVAVFAGFIFSGDPMVKQFGTALAIGILIDAFVIRLTLVPALMSFLGKSAWWLPGWLDRILPNLDVEGHRLEQHVRQGEPVDT